MEIDSRITSLNDFSREPDKFLKQLEENGEPVFLTVDGEPRLVVQDAAHYEHLLALKEKLETILAIREGLASIERGEGQTAEEVFEELYREFGIKE